jgi:SsrA-binding protein
VVQSRRPAKAVAGDRWVGATSVPPRGLRGHPSAWGSWSPAAAAATTLGGMAKSKKRKVAPGDVASNRYASYRFDLIERLECGIVLEGTEVKALRNGGAQLKEGYALIRDDEVYLVSVHIPPYAPASRNNHEPERDRKLLLRRNQIDKLKAQTKEKGLTLVPTRMYFSEGRAKVEIALAKGKDRFDKREAIKERETKRDMDRALREVNR